MSRKISFILITGVFLCGLAAIAYWMLFSTFSIYDDEGYILLSARDYFLKGKLYTTIYSQYGPAFYVTLDGLQRILGSPVDHILARLLTLAFWLGAAGCCGLMTWRQTASRSLSLFAFAATFLYLYFIADEPFHPGSLIFFVLAASLCASTAFITSSRLVPAAAVMGLTGAFLLLTKINVGIFYLAAVATWAVLHITSEPARRRARPWAVVVLILLAIALMHTLLRETWVQIYLAVFVSGSVSLVSAMKGEAVLKASHPVWFLATGASLAAAILVSVWLRGTDLAGLIDGVLLGPLRHPGNYSYPVDWRPGCLLIAALSPVFAVAQPWIRRNFSSEFADRIIVLVRLVLAVALLTGLALLMDFRAVGAIFSYVAPLIWIWVVPLNGVPPAPNSQICRGLLAAILLLQYLHAYPVGGSQESWGAFLFMPLVAVGLGDVRQWLMLRATKSNSTSRWWPRIAALFMAVMVAKIGWTALCTHRNYASRQALALPGAGLLHLPEPERSSYRILVLNAVVHTDMLFSLPGLFSFNLWSDLPAPTGKNTTLWFTLLNDHDQQQIIEALDHSPRPGLIIQESLILFMEKNGISATGVLHDYLQKKFTPVFRLDGFVFLAKSGRSVAALNVAAVHPRKPADPSTTDTEIDFNLVHEGEAIGSIELRDPTDSSKLLILDATNAQVAVTAIDTSGRPLTSATNTPWPLHFRGLNQMSIRFKHSGFILSPATTILSLRGSKGEMLDEIRIGE